MASSVMVHKCKNCWEVSEDSKDPKDVVGKAVLKFIVALCVAVLVVCSAILIWYYLKPMYLEWKKRKFGVKHPVTHINDAPTKIEPPIDLPKIIPTRWIDVSIDERAQPKHDCCSGVAAADKEQQNLDDIFKIGVYSKKEATREFPWFKNLNSMDILVPNLAKKLNKSKNKEAANYTEKEIIRDGEILVKGICEFEIPESSIKSAKIIAFNQTKILIPFVLDGKSEFGMIVPVSEGLKLKIESEIEEPVLDQSTSLDQPTLFRTDDSILIEQTEATVKQFILFHLRTPVQVRNQSNWKHLKPVLF